MAFSVLHFHRRKRYANEKEKTHCFHQFGNLVSVFIFDLTSNLNQSNGANKETKEKIVASFSFTLFFILPFSFSFHFFLFGLLLLPSHVYIFCNTKLCKCYDFVLLSAYLTFRHLSYISNPFTAYKKKSCRSHLKSVEQKNPKKKKKAKKESIRDVRC